MGRRSAPPLFELLQNHTQATMPPAAPARPQNGMPEPKPTRAVEPAPEPVREPQRERPERGVSAGEFSVVGGTIRMPVSYGLVALAVCLLAFVGSWALGYQTGEGKAEAAADARMQALAPGLDLHEPTTETPGRRTEPVARNDTPADISSQLPPPEHQETQPAPEGPPAAFDASGRLAGDSREPGLNYIRLGEMELDHAIEAIDRLSRSGVGAIAVRVDSGPRGSNNPARYQLYTTHGLTRDQYRNERADRDARLAAVKEVGRRWKAAGGPTDFHDALWAKLN